MFLLQKKTPPAADITDLIEELRAEISSEVVTG